ncbi:heme A synthase [Saccharomonospora sp. NB11]|uniref:COX15/CtaA family protein n=1 Tax=Saccharomonospora sp. NB11 TaxID=1642298 RepID=UPI0018D12709|nr:COX15/CtaA family protein [Saccharomonospora sp. NB11]
MQLSSLVGRLPYPSHRLQRALAVAAIVAQAGIGVTGSIVRVTGSGLGCPTWPQCFPGSMVPVEHPEYATLNQWIEYGNRLLTIAVVIVAALCVLAAWRVYLDHPNRKRLLRLAWVMPAGVVAQAVIGGITVLADLLWWVVALHFLPSTILVWMAVVLLRAFNEGDEPPRPLIPQASRPVLGALVMALAGLIVVGTMVTGAGPHGGDPDVERFDAPIATLATIHAAFLYSFLALLVVLGIQFRRAHADRTLWTRYAAVWAVAVGQGVLGIVQYRLGIPEPLVSLHVLGSMLVIAATAALWCATRDRGPVVSAVPAPKASAVGVS